MSNKRHMARRAFLRAAAGSVLALPLLHSHGAGAEEPTFPLRLVVVYNPNGTLPNEFFPIAGASETDFTLNKLHEKAFAPYKDKIIYTKGVHLDSPDTGPGEPHQSGLGGLLSGLPLQQGDFIGGDGQKAGWGSGISVDQVIAKHIGADTPLKSIELGVRSVEAVPRGRLCYSAPGTPIPPINDPLTSFSALFSMQNTDPGELAALRARRKSVLDAVSSQFALLGNQVGSLDKQRVEAHATMVRDIELSLDKLVVGGKCDAPSIPGTYDPTDEANFAAIAKLQIEHLVAGMACGMMNVGSIQFSTAVNHLRMPWLESFGNGHNLSHAGPSNSQAFAEMFKRDTWYAEQIAYMMSLMDQVKEGSGTMLDNTIIFWCNELSQGNTHSHKNMPFVLLGGGGGKFRMGRYLQYSDESHNNLLIALLNAFGIETNVFGDPAFCTGALSGVLV